ncbi:RsmB/NOP family class I SAM-dependent RNA methyltransferase [Paenibacillus harenae]|uniref:RsmB/NOP family class I SAM-dependent RNA methyltransferase n=1 Tax=Paenibacillus harenae TaxID=306543 RepID=UPI0027915E7E|nr:RsmB/NOP family class I SAM-dependent RNA methyltransferase [Paenibacillus harenae]MDQ0058419.1 NOL1/NOP2/sun family putative RNA methylase [Paenibacillus harenae]
MIGQLPTKFTKKMEKLLGSEYDNFMASYAAPRVYGLRINALKLAIDQWKELSPIAARVRPIPWAQDGLYYVEEDRPGKHPHYYAGLYYIQEPSAMAPVELLDVKPGHRVLDLCAAPGGKSTQIAAKLAGKGVLVANDNAQERTKALTKNIERAGVRNAVILNEEPAALAPVFTEWFDRILIDAPCSGEGMFRKDESMIADWEKHSVEHCAVMQRDILRHAARMLAPGGMLVYSTCTFSPEEDEWQIAALLAERDDFEVVPIPQRYGWAEGRADLAAAAPEAAELAEGRLSSIEGTVRLWPHRIEGEGHYAAVLRRREAKMLERESARDDRREEQVLASAEAPDRQQSRRKKEKLLRASEKRGGKAANERGRSVGVRKEVVADPDPIGLWKQFSSQFVEGTEVWEGHPIAYGSRIYLQPAGMPSLNGLKVVRAGWYVGEADRGKFVPSQPLAMGLSKEEAVRSVSFRSDDAQTLRYLRGETLFAEDDEIVRQGDTAAKGYVLVCTDGYPLGWAKYAGGMIKNELPAGWRWI